MATTKDVMKEVPHDMAYVIQVKAFVGTSARYGPDPYNQFIKGFTWEPDDQGTADLTAKIAEAKQFDTYAEAFEYWCQAKGVRPDGQPNRPLTAFTVEIIPVLN